MDIRNANDNDGDGYPNSGYPEDCRGVISIENDCYDFDARVGPCAFCPEGTDAEGRNIRNIITYDGLTYLWCNWGFSRSSADSNCVSIGARISVFEDLAEIASVTSGIDVAFWYPGIQRPGAATPGEPDSWDFIGLEPPEVSWCGSGPDDGDPTGTPVEDGEENCVAFFPDGCIDDRACGDPTIGIVCEWAP
jgi:hypothetical protein